MKETNENLQRKSTQTPAEIKNLRQAAVLLHRERETCYRQSWNCYYRRIRFVVICRHFCFILSTHTRIRIDSVMRPRSSSKGRNTSASVTVSYILGKVKLKVMDKSVFNVPASLWHMHARRRMCHYNLTAVSITRLSIPYSDVSK